MIMKQLNDEEKVNGTEVSRLSMYTILQREGIAKNRKTFLSLKITLH